MKNRTILISVFILALLLTSCNSIPIVGDRLITPSDVIITEERPVSGFDAIDFSTMGVITIIQGDSESLTISGSDNLVPLVMTTVRGSTLTIRTEEGITVSSIREENLNFTITVKDLTSLEVSGLGDVRIGSLSTTSLAMEMSGAGRIRLDQFSADNLDINVSGLGTVEVSGQVRTVSIEISGAGTVDAPNLQIQNADVSVPGLGSATVWVTDQLSGNISGAGTVSYYGSPQLQTNSSGLGSFQALGNK
jgi:Putative auto-transporter adhesin, head GIN domain